MSWASNRRAIYAGSVIVFLVIIVGVSLFYFLYKAPSCFDGKRNQGETSVDVGGPCALLDEQATQPHLILWARAFPVRTGEYAAVAYIENPNRNAAALNVPYKFSFYDSSNIIIAEKTGYVSLMPGVITPVFISNIYSGSRVVARSFFEFTGAVSWTRAGNTAKVLSNSNIRVAGTEMEPKVSVTVKNTDVESREDIEYIATVFDAVGNAFASSKTVVSKLSGGESKDLVFTWPTPFVAKPARIDVIPVTAPSVE